MSKTKPTKPAKRIVKKTVTKVEGVSAPVVGMDGKSKSHINLPKDLFDVKINKQLLAQAVRVYLANQRQGTASTKTRGEVEGSTRKIYRQKGTGRARHGAIRAPIFVGGGIVFGPTPRDYSLKMPQVMRRAALASALTQQYKAGNVIVADGFEAHPPKTNVFAKSFSAMGATVDTLLVTTKQANAVTRGAKNLSYIDLLPATSLHTYAVLSHRKIVFMKETIKELKELFDKQHSA